MFWWYTTDQAACRQTTQISKFRTCQNSEVWIPDEHKITKSLIPPNSQFTERLIIRRSENPKSHSPELSLLRRTVLPKVSSPGLRSKCHSCKLDTRNPNQNHHGPLGHCYNQLQSIGQQCKLYYFFFIIRRKLVRRRNIPCKCGLRC